MVAGAWSWSALVVVSLLLEPAAIGRAELKQSGGTAPDVCTLLPAEEAKRILGWIAVRTRSSRPEAGAMECSYSGAGGIAIVVGAGTPKPKWDTFMKDLAEAGATLEPVSGVGDGANFWDAERLYAHTGNYQIAVTITPIPGEAEAKVRANAIAMAKALIAKLR
jgi:hypothetical protein